VQSISKKSINKIEEHLSGDPVILLLTHTNPDGDAIGSILAMYHYLVMRGFKTYAVTPNNFPDFLKWLPGNDEIIKFSQEKERVQEIMNQAEMIFNLDFNEPERLGNLGDILVKADALKVLIDHHPQPKPFCDVVIHDTSVSSTAELIYYMLSEMSISPFLNKEIAESLFVGIMTDTGCFSFNSSKSRTYTATAKLLEAGIDKDEIFENVYNNFSADRMRLAGYALNEKMVIIPELHTAYISLTMKEMKKYNYSLGDTEGFVNLPLSVKGIRFSALFLEKPDRVKISFRSKGSFPANLFSKNHFNGGGHHNAAGGESFQSLDETLHEFETVLKKYKGQLSQT
jgi:phosphoesterase RecJ-like protein